MIRRNNLRKKERFKTRLQLIRCKLRNRCFWHARSWDAETITWFRLRKSGITPSTWGKMQVSVQFLGCLKANSNPALLQTRGASTFRTLEWSLSANKLDLIIANKPTPQGLPHKVTVLPLIWLSASPRQSPFSHESTLIMSPQKDANSPLKPSWERGSPLPNMVRTSNPTSSTQ